MSALTRIFDSGYALDGTTKTATLLCATDKELTVLIIFTVGNRLTAVFVVLSRVASLIKRINICNFQGSIEPFSLALFFHKSLDTTLKLN